MPTTSSMLKVGLFHCSNQCRRKRRRKKEAEKLIQTTKAMVEDNPSSSSGATLTQASSNAIGSKRAWIWWGRSESNELSAVAPGTLIYGFVCVGVCVCVCVFFFLGLVVAAK
jgi:hypothetical protein